MPNRVVAQNGPDAIGSVSVTPDGASEPTREVNTGPYSTVFWVTNNYHDRQVTYQLSCHGLNNVTCLGLDLYQVTLGPDAGIDIEATYSVGAAHLKGKLVVEATGAAQDTGYYNIVITDPAPPIIALRNHNGDNRDRSLCVTAGAGEAAAWQCGDLLVSHGLPAYATMGQERALTLLYSSAQAVPKPIVVASVTEASLIPSQVFVRLSLNGIPKDSAFYNGWGNGTRQIAIAHDAVADSTGIYPFTLLVRNIFAGSVQDATLSDTLIVVNRTGSLYGAGWSPAGVEELRLNQPGNKILWVGGDGSAKVYRSIGTDTFVGAAGAFRDTLVRFDSAAVGWWRRRLRHGVSVTYSDTGSAGRARHVRTTNRVGQSTVFAWSKDTLKSLTVPPGVGGTTYTLTYVSGKLDKITDPAGRVLDVTIGSNRLTQIIDPDNAAYHTDFSYDGPGRMTGRTTRRGYTTAFTYANGLRVTRVSIPVGRVTGDTTTATTGFSPWDEKGLAIGPNGQTAVDTALVYTKIDGPRLSPIADTARFWVDRWGAPSKTVDPFGATLTVKRQDAAVPALATQIQYPNGRTVRLSWNNRGNLTQTRDSTWHLADTVRLQTAVSRWTYSIDPVKQDSPDSAIDSTSTGMIVTRFFYSALGLTDSVIAPNGHGTRFFTRSGPTDPLRGVLDSVIERQVPAWVTVTKVETLTDLRTKFLYNALGNLIRTTSPSGRVDSLGRDAAQRVTNHYDPAGHRVEMVYDPLNRLLQSIQHVEGLDSGFSTPLVTQAHYAIDLVDQITDQRGVARSYTYDFAGRRVAEIDDYGLRDSTFHERSGLVDSLRPRFYQDSAGRAIRFTYDNNGRVIKKRWPARDSVPADSITYTYDVMGNMLTATQAGWKLTRTYYANGALRSEIQAHPDGSNRFTIFYAYDRIGRRAWYRSGTPGNAAERDSIWYRYDSVSGELRTITVRWRGSLAPLDSVRFRWDALGRRDTVAYRNGLMVRFAYDADGALRVVCGAHPGGPSTGPDVFDFQKYDSLVTTDGLVLITSYEDNGITGCGSNQSLSGIAFMTYDSRHQLLTQNDDTPLVYRYDASGNMTVRQRSQVENVRFTMDALHNRLRIFYNAAALQLDDSTHIVYERDGVRRVEQPYLNGAPVYGIGTGYRYYWYDGLGRTTGTGEWECIPGAGDESGPGAQCQGGQFYSFATACRYDPLGRVYDPCENGAPNLGYDGENVVRTGADSYTIEWSIVHGPGLDDPIMGYRNAISPSQYDYLYYVTDGQGSQFAVADTIGNSALTDVAYRRGGKLAGGTRYASSFYSARYSNKNMLNMSSFRNRFYDQSTGRWTQEDPIGVTGGVNLYNFNGNNPVAYTDPFGLCPENMKESKKECDKWNTVRASDVRGYYDKQHAAGNPGTRLIPYSLDRQPIRGVSGSEINAIGNCPATTATGCTRPGQEMVINVDRPIPAAATTVAHENVHAAGFNQQWEGLAQAVARVFMVNLPTPDRLTAEVAGAGPRPTDLIVPWLHRPF
jgi:RHS repeat-associated protein